MSTPKAPLDEGRGPAFTIEVIRTLREADKLREEWDDLLEVAPYASIYQSPTWVLEWYETFGGRWSVFLVIVRDADDRLVALAPFARASIGPWSWLPQCLISVGAEHDATGEILIRPGEESVARTIVGLLDDLVAERRTIVRVAPICEDATYGSALLASRVNRQIVSRIESSILRLPGDSVDDPVDRLVRKNRIPRRRRRLEEECGPVEVVVGSCTPELLAHVQHMLLARWGADAGPALWSIERRARFTTSVFSKLAKQDRARSVSLVVAGRPVAIQVITNVGNVYVFEVIAHDQDMAQFGLGNQVLGEALAHVSALGAREVDFRAPAMDYKDAWSSEHRRLASVIVVRPGLYGKLTLRPYALMRRWRRRHLGRST